MKIDIEDVKYPKELRKIQNPPNQLYLKGNVELLDTFSIAIIGSRKCTKYGEKMAKKFSSELNLYGVTIISGMAEGIDSFSHIGSIETTGNTIAVLPCGLNNIYPRKNIDLYEKILENGGLVLTEYEESEEASLEKFLERNRIVSGLANGTLVIEGGYRSGTSVTANLTRKQGKNLFCIPSNLESSKGITPNRLIKEGAFLVTNVEDIICKYPHINFKKQELKQKEVDFVDEEYKDIYNILNREDVIHVNELVKKLDLPVNDINYKLMMLELQDKIVSLPGNNYKKK